MGKDIVVAGHTRSFGAGLHDFLLLKTDSLGNLQWIKTYGGSNEDWAYSVYETYEPGSTESFGAGLKDLLTVAQTKTNLSKSNRLPIRVLSSRVIPNPSARDFWTLWL